MKPTFILKTFFCLTMAMFVVSEFSAAPAYPHPVTYALPDGSEITLQLRGDEWTNWAVSTDGFTLLFNSDGFLEYAVQDASGDLQLSGVRARNEPERTAAEQHFLSNVKKSLSYSSSQKAVILKARGVREDWMHKSTDGPKRILSGTVRIPIILVEFRDVKFTKTKADFELLFNQLNYTQGGLTGSLRDYFLANSYGQMNLQVDVFGIYTLPANVSNYANSTPYTTCTGDPRRMARLAMDSAYADGADFSDYVLDGSENVDAVHIIFAGYGAESGGAQCASIWSHAWELQTDVEYNGKILKKYSCSPELRGNSGSNMTYIGVLAHELGHSLCKLPDFYDADQGNSGGQAIDIGNWCIMGTGNWNDSGRTPALFSAYARAFTGWVPVVELAEPKDIVMPNPHASSESVIYSIQTPTENEYFLLENRQKMGWDAFVPGSGLLIYHVDKNVSGWTNNALNNNPSRRGYAIRQAGCPDEGTGGCGSNRETDPFPQPGKTAFTDSTTPNSKSYAGLHLGKPITNITHHTTNRTISFEFMGGDPPTYMDLALTEILVPNIILGENVLDMAVKIHNQGAPVQAATIQWSVNGEAQTPYHWTGNLKFDSSAIVTLGTYHFVEDDYLISVSVDVDNDSIPENNTREKNIQIVNAFFMEDFEDPESTWVFANGTQTNQWHIGTATASEGTRSVYISNNEGVVNQYITSRMTKVHLYYDIAFPASTDSFDLFFDVKVRGEFENTDFQDYMEVRVVDTGVTPVAAEELTNGTRLGRYANSTTPAWQTEHCSLSPSYSNKTQRLVISWYNDGSGGSQPPAAIDNIYVAVRPKQTSTSPNFPEHIGFEVYPNPVTNGELKIRLTEVETGDYSHDKAEIFDMNGKRVYVSRLNSSATLQISHLPAGAYILKIGINSIKIIKK